MINEQPQEIQGRELIVSEPYAFIKPGTVSWFDCIWVLGLAIGLTYLVRKLGTLFKSRSFKRAVPFLYVTIWTFSVLLLIYFYAEGLPDEAWFALLIILVLVAVAAFLDEIRSTVAGIIMSFDHNIHVGDAIRIGSIEGKVVAFRLRFVRVEAPDGVVHDIPNTQFQKYVTSNFSEHGEHSRCLIQVPLPEGVKADEAIEAARMACILSPYASIYLKPEVLLSERGDLPHRFLLNIHAFAFDQNVRDAYRSDILKRLEKTLFP